MKRHLVTFVTLLVVLTFEVRAIEPAAAKNSYPCDQARGFIGPCVDYLVGMGGAVVPSSTCCNGVSEVKGSATTTEDRRAACQCLKDTATSLPNFREDKAAILPKLCAVSLGFPISQHADCVQIP